MSLINQAIEIIEAEKRDSPTDKEWFSIQIRRFEKAAEKFDYIANDNPSGSSYRNEAYKAKNKILNTIDEWQRLYGHLK